MIAHRHEILSKGHAELLVPMIQSALTEAATQYRDLGLVAVTIGPGTFTGIRVGLSAARGIALTTGVQVAGVTTLAAIAEGARASSLDGDAAAIVVFHDARREELFCQIFPAGAEESARTPELIAQSDAVSVLPSGSVMVVGSGVAQVRDQISRQRPDVRFSDAATNPDAIHVANVGLNLAGSGDVGITPPEPLYLRAPDARLPGIQMR